jgi:hypothetical protein
MKRRILSLVGTILLVLATCQSVGATPLRVRVVDAMGTKGVANVLVITRSLEPGKGDIARALTSQDGSIPDLNIAPGLYEVIATYPYRAWRTRVRDFVAAANPIVITLELEQFWDQTVYAGGVIDLRVQVLDAQGHPVPEAKIVARNLDATELSLATTDSAGRATVRIPTDGAEVTTLYGDHSQVNRIDIDSRKQDCQLACVKSSVERLSKTPHNLTVRLE